MLAVVVTVTTVAVVIVAVNAFVVVVTCFFASNVVHLSLQAKRDLTKQGHDNLWYGHFIFLSTLFIWPLIKGALFWRKTLLFFLPFPLFDDDDKAAILRLAFNL